MAFSLTWLSQVLLDAGLKVAPTTGWEFRGIGDLSQLFGVMCHHTAGPRQKNMPSLDTLIHGRSDLSGPLAQLGLGRDGTYYLISAGRCNHAGGGVWNGVTGGNSHFLGIEAENTGKSDDQPWPDIQMEAYRHGVAAILRHIGRDATWCVGHKEYALPPGRKPDPSFDMPQFRFAVAQILSGDAAAVAPIPAVEGPKSDGAPARPTLRRPALGDFVKQVQAKLGLQQDGIFGSRTEAALRAFQRDHALVPDGIVGPRTWTVLDRVV